MIQQVKPTPGSDPLVKTPFYDPANNDALNGMDERRAKRWRRFKTFCTFLSGVFIGIGIAICAAIIEAIKGIQ